MTRFFPRRLGSALVLVGVLGVLLPGCSRPTGSISGKVTYQGKPLKGGNVSFQSTEGRESFAATIGEDGTYSVPKIIGGSYKVCVETDSLKPSGGAPGMSKGPSDPKDAKAGPPPGAQIPEGYKVDNTAMGARAAENRKRYVQIPPAYAKPETTDLAYEFKGGTETYDINLK